VLPVIFSRAREAPRAAGRRCADRRTVAAAGAGWISCRVAIVIGRTIDPPGGGVVVCRLSEFGGTEPPSLYLAIEPERRLAAAVVPEPKSD
jgi:hypothetical protein